ncbi:hypothetical protein ACFQY8_00660 [Alloscardovia venturai]|uniref:Uncharacterized protein n=1 Tax=Alloscardovia venturai TaxID=1769421 RepID=A0ABW2Y3A1_9BIFI
MNYSPADFTSVKRRPMQERYPSNQQYAQAKREWGKSLIESFVVVYGIFGILAAFSYIGEHSKSLHSLYIAIIGWALLSTVAFALIFFCSYLEDLRRLIKQRTTDWISTNDQGMSISVRKKRCLVSWDSIRELSIVLKNRKGESGNHIFLRVSTLSGEEAEVIFDYGMKEAINFVREVCKRNPQVILKIPGIWTPSYSKLDHKLDKEGQYYQH